MSSGQPAYVRTGIQILLANVAAQSVAVYAFIIWASTPGALIIEGEDWLIHRRPYVRARINLKAIKLYRNANKTRTLDVRINPGG